MRLRLLKSSRKYQFPSSSPSSSVRFLGGLRVYLREMVLSDLSLSQESDANVALLEMISCLILAMSFFVKQGHLLGMGAGLPGFSGSVCENVF